MSGAVLVKALGEHTGLGFVATQEGEESSTVVYEIWTDKSLEEVRALVAKIFDRTRCGHEHDCCGCWFRATTRVVSEFDRESVAYLVIDRWARNI